MDRRDDATITTDDVSALAHVAGLALDDERTAALAAGLEADMQAIRRLRAVDAGELHPLGATALSTGQR
jgi:Asp-tRNA(Asn)/Glu-tRNA(Gln) amidotransferase C subunit